MYEKYFGLKEIPFSIAPNPRYLYMSEQHHEALAHLVYGVEKDGGFILLTGEVGTGKTTVCRCFLEQLPADCEVAFILNPKLTIVELLATTCDELGIFVDPEKPTTKVYLDAIYDYLLAAHANEKKVLLIIDEAQNLSVDVLEQIRLLTNLETNRRKLLQIVLLGQPELRKLFELPELRQLAQRITARYHLKNLSLTDIQAYVQHRLEVAGCMEPLFPLSVIKLLRRYSGGIPRLINVLCDRALLGAFAEGARVVDKKMMKKAAREVMGNKGNLSEVMMGQVRTKIRFKLALSACLFIAAALVALMDVVTREEGQSKTVVSSPTKELSQAEDLFNSPTRSEVTSRLDTQTQTELEKEKAILASIQPQPIPPQLEDDPMVEALSRQIAAVESVIPRSRSQDIRPEQQWKKSQLASLSRSAEGTYSQAFAVLLQVWGFEFSNPSQLRQPCEHVKAVKMACVKGGNKRIQDLLEFNRPAIVTLQYADNPKTYAVLRSLSSDQAILFSKNYEHRLPYDSFVRFWTGEFTLVWQQPPEFYGTIVPGTIGGEVKWFAELLGSVLNDRALKRSVSYYDEKMVAKVKKYQRRKGLDPDGVVGAKTIMALMSDTNPKIPVLEK